MTLNRSQVTALLEANDVRPSRALGQNFVADANTVRRIVRLAGVGAGDRVVEIGAGLGCLTMALAEVGADVTAIEIDKRMVPILRAGVEPLGVRVIEGDATALAWDEVLDPGLGSWALVANLPYNVATPLVLDLLDLVPQVDSILVMVQREVAERLAAGPGTKAYGGASVKVAYWATAAVVGMVPASVFVPKPNVESALVRIVRRPDGPAVDPMVVTHEHLFGLVRRGFSQRRKMLRGLLADVVSPAAFAAAGIDPTRRAEDLDVHDWGRLATAAARERAE